jgi:hypothetical protein
VLRQLALEYIWYIVGTTVALAVVARYLQQQRKKAQVEADVSVLVERAKEMLKARKKRGEDPTYATVIELRFVHHAFPLSRAVRVHVSTPRLHVVCCVWSVPLETGTCSSMKIPTSSDGTGPSTKRCRSGLWPRRGSAPTPASRSSRRLYLISHTHTHTHTHTHVLTRSPQVAGQQQQVFEFIGTIDDETAQNILSPARSRKSYPN